MSSCRRGRCTVPTEQTSKPRTEDLPVLTEIRDQTLAIRLNRPRKYNAFNSEMLQLVTSALLDADAKLSFVAGFFGLALPGS